MIYYTHSLPMSDSNLYEPTASELEILQILWEHEPASVRFVHEQITQKREVGYTTILKQLQRLYDKKVVERELKGKTHYYRAIPKQEEVQMNLFRHFLHKVYKGSAMNLVMHAFRKGNASPEEIEELQKWLKDQQKEQDD